MSTPFKPPDNWTFRSPPLKKHIGKWFSHITKCHLLQNAFKLQVLWSSHQFTKPGWRRNYLVLKTFPRNNFLGDDTWIIYNSLYLEDMLANLRGRWLNKEFHFKLYLIRQTWSIKPRQFICNFKAINTFFVTHTLYLFFCKFFSPNRFAFLEILVFDFVKCVIKFSLLCFFLI